MPNISIIVPVYKVEHYLSRCINSILAQTYRDFELILVNDGSPDNCGDICDKFARIDERVKVIHKNNGGLSSARNAGLNIAKGKYIGFIDSDDWISEDMYEYLLNLIEEYKCKISGISYILTDGSKKFKQDKIKVKCYSREESLYYYLKIGMAKRASDFSVCNKLYDASLFNELRFPIGQLYEDGATNFILLQKSNKYVRSNKIAYFYFQGNSGITKSGFKYKDLDIIKVGNQLIDLSLQENNKKTIMLAKMKHARSYMSLLLKIALYGFEEEIDNKDYIIKNLTHNLRKRYFLLVISPMPLDRKLMMTLLCININCIRTLVRIMQILKKFTM